MKAIDKYLIVSFLFVFCSLVEYAIVLLLDRGKRKFELRKKEVGNFTDKVNLGKNITQTNQTRHVTGQIRVTTLHSRNITKNPESLGKLKKWFLTRLNSHIRSKIRRKMNVSMVS